MEKDCSPCARGELYQPDLKQTRVPQSGDNNCANFRIQKSVEEH